jgi:hypothetical protein
MATSTQTGQEVTCPLCKEYSGEPASVEAHISRKTDEAHKGETGNQHREELQPGGATVSSSSSSSGSPSSSEPERGAGPDLAEPVEEIDESSEESSDFHDSESVAVPVPSKPTDASPPQDDESDESGEEAGEDVSLVTVALLVLGGYIFLKIVVSRNASNQQRQGLPPGL